ncbi:hypothetical protein [Actibacterium sp. 188UL27-1]|uniref:hypothetical protein n=1 Tax=Actibacterium sp. 188UL27-1 TaxID=2786961 RepID=UPI001956D716|nr:hypothetical protein [Actibacterium sp. 188UL27-1]MBM7068859.1 hypothetical protein [Actibacterium sp. 188UL27-1]
MTRIIVYLIVALSVCLPAQAKNRLAQNGAIVLFEAKSDVEFRVLGRAGFGPSDYFCAAGEFARFTLNARPADRVVLTKPPTRDDRTVGFELRRNAARADVFNRDVFLTLRKAGQSRSVGHADGLCQIKKFQF